MGKKFGLAAVGIGGFLIVLALLLKFFAYGSLAVVPLDQKSTTVSKTAPGADATYLNVAAAGGPAIEQGPLESRRVVVGQVDDGEKLSDDRGQKLAVWDTFTYTAPPGTDPEDAISGTRDLVAFDRVSGKTVKWDDSFSEEGDDKTQPANFEGLYFKFPFNTQKKSYDFWDGSLGKATPATYEGTDKLDGLSVYKFVQKIEPTTIAQLDVPGSLVGMTESSVKADRVYANTRTLWVEPETGVIIKGQEEQFATLDVNGEPKATITDATLGYDDETVKKTVDEYSSKATQLHAVRSTVPLVAGIVGVVLLILGAVLIVSGRATGRSNGGAHSDDREPAKV